MNASAFAAGAALFLAGLAVHVVAWRVRRPRHQALGLLAYFMLPWAAFCVWARARGAGWTPFELAAAGLLDFSLTCAYVQTYPAFQGFSPSFVVVLLLARAPGGLTREELLASVDEGVMLTGRLQDMVDSRLIAERDGLLELTPSGRALVSFFVWMRRVMGLPLGTG